jgi:putative membrane protein
MNKGSVMGKHFPLILLGLYLLLFIILAISPFDRAVWWAENIPIIIIVTVIIIVSRYFQFSNLSYFMMFLLVVLHTIGGHFTFERVPFDDITDLFGFERNHYDRIAHFTVGFYAFPIAEILQKKQLVRSKFILFLFPVFTIFSVAAIYEVIEWLYAVSADEAAGAAMLGSQGDIWDAQKDMLADGLGSIVAMILFRIVNKKDIQQIT